MIEAVQGSIEEDTVFENMDEIQHRKDEEGGTIGMSVSNAIFHPISTSYDVLRWASGTVGERVVLPVADRLSSSIINPNVLGSFIFERIKRMTPQRARDISRFVSTLLSNFLLLAQGERGEAASEAKQDLLDSFVSTAASEHGRNFVVNSIASLNKVAISLDTPESKQATKQIFLTLENFIDILSSTEGKKLLRSINEMIDKSCEVFSSPESLILLAEAATNIVHGLEIESISRQQSYANEDSENSKCNRTTDLLDSKKNRSRCAEIEKKVLKRMGVSDAVSCLSEIKNTETSASNDLSDTMDEVILPDWNTDDTRRQLRDSRKVGRDIIAKRDPMIEKSNGVNSELYKRQHGLKHPLEEAIERICFLVFVGFFLLLLTICFLFILYVSRSNAPQIPSF